MNSEENYTKKCRYVRELLSFKLLLCNRENCGFKIKTQTYQLQPCQFYHSESDRRRFPFEGSPEIFEKCSSITRKFKESSIYSLANFFSDISRHAFPKFSKGLCLRYSNYLMTDESAANCLNYVEFAYHPLNYKREKCDNGDKCPSIYCPFYHDQNELSEFKAFRNLMIPLEDVYRIFERDIKRYTDQVFKNLKALKEIQLGNCKLMPENAISKEIRNKHIKSEEIPNTLNEEINHHVIFPFPFGDQFGSQAQKELMINTIGKTQMQPLSKKFTFFEDNQPVEATIAPYLINLETTVVGKIGTHVGHILEEKALLKQTQISKTQTLPFSQSANTSIYRRMESHKFVLKETVSFLENENLANSFYLSKLDLVDVSKFICALLNSNGGTIFYGLTRKFIVNGQKISRKDFDFFQVNLDVLLRNFQPRVMPDQIKIDLHKVYNHQKDQHPIPDLYVVHFSVYSCGPDVYYSTDLHLFFVKHESVIKCLKNHEIVDHVQARMPKEIKKEHLMQRINPQIFERMVQKDLDRVIENFEELLGFLLTLKNGK